MNYSNLYADHIHFVCEHQWSVGHCWFRRSFSCSFVFLLALHVSFLSAICKMCLFQYFRLDLITLLTLIVLHNFLIMLFGILSRNIFPWIIHSVFISHVFTRYLVFIVSALVLAVLENIGFTLDLYILRSFSWQSSSFVN